MLPMLILRRDKTSCSRLMIPSVAFSTQSMTTTRPCALPSLRTRRRAWARKLRLLRISWKLLEDSRALLERLRSLLEPLLLLTTLLRLLMPGRMLLLLSSRTSRKHLVPCSQKTELPGQWTSKKTLLPSLRSSRPMQRLSRTFCPRVTRFQLMPRHSRKMTTHAEADAEVAGLKERYDKVKAISGSWVKKLEVLVKEWVLLDNTVTELNSWMAKDKSAEGENQFSLEKMESTLGELKNIFKEKEKLVEG